MERKTKPCPTCGGQYEVHGVEGAKAVHPSFPNVLVARSDNHWMFNVWLRGADGKSHWTAWISERGLEQYVKGLQHARKLQEMGGLMPSEQAEEVRL